MLEDGEDEERVKILSFIISKFNIMQIIIEICVSQGFAT